MKSISAMIATETESVEVSKSSNHWMYSSSNISWWTGWAGLCILPMFVFLLPAGTPRWVTMWTLAFAIYVGCKWLTWRRTLTRKLPVWRHLGYLFAWPGMDASAFLYGNTPKPPSSLEYLFAFIKTLAGAGIWFLLAPKVPDNYPYYAGWLAMVGAIFFLHFGVFHLLSCFWRWCGVNARPVMHWPILAVSVSAFWGQRWNTAFRDLTYRFLFRPLTKRFSPTTALLGGFLTSGLIHEVVISLPAGGGFGGPTAFFMIQSVAMLVERSVFGKRIGLGSGWRGWIFTNGTLLLTVGLLLHPPFVVGVIVPFLVATGGLE